MKTQEELTQEIYYAFRGVTRTGGVSWDEALLIDQFSSEEKVLNARMRDKNRRWRDLVDSKKWDPSPIEAWAHLDAIGWRYYIAPAMIRWLRDGVPHMAVYSMRSERRTTVLDRFQTQCIRNFIEYVIESQRNGGYDVSDWVVTLDSHPF